MSVADSIDLRVRSAREGALTTSGQNCILTYSSPGIVSNCNEPVPAVLPVSPWLQHGGGIFDSQRLPISITFAGVVRGITLESTGALKCAAASHGRIKGYRGGVEVVNVENTLIDPADCGADDVTFGVRGQVPASVAVDSLVIVGPDPWTFDVLGLNGRASLYYTITYDPSLALDCGVVIRGQTATCAILDSVDAVSGWRFDGPVLPGLNDSVHVASAATGLTWSGVGVISGKVSAIVTVGGQIDTVSGSLTVADRTGPAWRWDSGNKWTVRQDGPPLCAYSPFVDPGATRLGVNRRTSGCFEFDQDQRVSIEPSVRSSAAQDSGFTAASVAGGPNDGLWYVTAVHYYMDRTSEMNPLIRSGGPTSTLTNSTDQRVCRQALNLGKNAPVVVNFHTYNTVCRSFSLTPLFSAIWAHEGLGTNDPLNPLQANGHEARRRIAARDPVNDPYRIAEPLIRASYAELLNGVALDVYDAEREISAAADADHAFVHSNYLVQGNCGKAWVFNTIQQAFVQIAMQMQRPDGTFTCI
ncbi:MAG: hypothetical protein ACYC2K_16735 [Gemmatimonadales bacterium]